ncbi:MAG TPA: hypothetical protein VEB66_13495 [Opitutaceae bacterium]|nr:hypothetical protein [Opitutaceae bacterium]
MRLSVNLPGLAPWAVLVLGAALLQSVPGPPERAGEWRLLGPVAGTGALPAAAGGWRAPAADVLWLRANLAWERRDAVATETLARAAVALEPEVDYFRINTARIIAFDLPEWGLDPTAPAEVARRRRAQHVRRALELLASRPGDSAAVLVERARLTHQGLGDSEAAGELFRAAAERPDAPYFAGRLSVELLIRAGRAREAREWLRAWLPRLPAGDPEAQRARMEARLRELDRLIGP